MAKVDFVAVARGGQVSTDHPDSLLFLTRAVVAIKKLPV